MTRGKNICRQLKEVRRRIAEENGIPLEIKECTYQGECRGTCPRCEAEVRYLERALKEKLRFGKVATVAGLSLGLAACGGQPLEGEFPNPDTTDAAPPSDTTAPVSDTAKPLWRAPELSDNIYLGETELNVNLDTLFVGSEVVGFIPAEVDPEFPGGMEALWEFIQSNLHYPQLALENNISGRVYVQFEVDTDGTVLNPRLLRDIGGGCGKEALRVVGMMPKWKPGKINGKVARIPFNLPVKFEIDESNRVSVIEGASSETFINTNELPPSVNHPEYRQEPDRTTIIIR
jgi:TonB family protein